MFHGAASPHCEPVADANDDEAIDLTDAVFVLEHLFLGGKPVDPLSPTDRELCDVPNRAPVVQPIGTIAGQEGVELAFRVLASDPDRDDLTYTIESAPDGLVIDSRRGFVTWTPGSGLAGDHRIRVLVIDDGIPSRSAFATGLLRIRQGNQAPVIDEPGTIYGRDGVPLEFQIRAQDGDGDRMSFELREGPPTSSIGADDGIFRWLPRDGDAGEHGVGFESTTMAFRSERVTDNSALLRETYGFGTGRFPITDGDGKTYDVSAFLDEAGQRIGDFPHPGTGPVSEEVRKRALSTPVTPHPRQ